MSTDEQIAHAKAMAAIGKQQFEEDRRADAPPMPLTTAEMIEKFIALRDKITEVKKAHTTQLAPYNAVMDALEARILHSLNEQGADSIKTGVGTVYKSTRTSASVKDWPATLAFIKAHEAWDLLEARVAKTAVLATIEETGAPVPGVNISQETTLNVRRS